MVDPSSGLADRLRRIQGLTRAAPANADAKQSPRRMLPEWEQLSRFLWVRITDLPNPLTESRPLPLLTSRLDDDRLLFIDTETTGLSGGAGTVAFLVGVGRVRLGYFRVAQYFISDYPGEPELIEALAGELTKPMTVVSYNGKSFDIPILRSRFSMNGRRLEVSKQVDLLHTARRLWKASIGSCSLHAIEERVLGVKRSEDVPGYLIPELYFNYLRSGDPDPLSGVFSHHLYDIVSLATLLDYIETIPKREMGSGGVDPDELGRLMVDLGFAEGLPLLRERALAGSLPAARIASLHLKRQGRWGDAVEIWTRLWEGSQSYFAGIELAKYYEHRVKEYANALEIVAALSALPLRGTPWAAAARQDLAKRRNRLSAKHARRRVASGGAASGAD
ncbi:MAG TPA: ribonuclease H-like domain-containing protein [Spirochaetia bacterium]|nr:ribonuclease H-like domain-containing protein [Spirochaetia bacterium]